MFKTLKSKVLATVLGLVLISNNLTAVLLFSIADKGLQKSVESTMNQVAKNVALQIEEANVREFRMLNTIAQLDYYRSESVKLKDKIHSMSLSTTNIDKNYDMVSIFDAFGYSYDKNGKKIDMADSITYDKAMLGKKWITDPEFIDGNYFTTYSVPIFDRDLQPSGAVYAKVKADRMYLVCSNMNVGKNSHPLIVNMKNGTIIGADDLDLITGKKSIKDTTNPEFKKIADSICKGESSWGFYKDTESGKKMVISYCPIGQTCEWAVLCRAPYSDYFGSLQKMSAIFLIAFAFIAISSSIITIILLSRVLKPLTAVKDSINEIATGNADLTQRISNATQDEIGDVVNGFNLFAEKLQNIIKDIKESNTSLSDTGDNLSQQIDNANQNISNIFQNIQDIHGEIQNQSNEVIQTSSTVNEITIGITSLKQKIDEQSADITDASAAIEQMISNINSVNNSIDLMTTSFSELNTSAKEGFKQQDDVNTMIKTIEEQSAMLTSANEAIAAIAEQTNLLAMNAAIEAAHAGDAGKGFSVVADEIRKLSETSTEQSHSIGDQLQQIDNSIKSMVIASEKSKSTFEDVTVKIEHTNSIVNQVKTAMEEQNRGSIQISQALHTMNDKTSYVKIASEEMALSSSGIQTIINSLQKETDTITDKMDRMNEGAQQIKETSNILSQISESVEISINDIGNQINQFKV